MVLLRTGKVGLGSFNDSAYFDIFALLTVLEL